MSEKVPNCDADNAGVYVVRMDGDRPVYGCRCMVCSRCKRHTGNNTQGHYWSWCSVTRSMREFHFCCPTGCELEAGEAA